MTQPVDTLRFNDGRYAEIYYDRNAEQPFADDDAVRIVVLHRRYIDPSNGECGRCPDELAEWQRENADEWFTIPLFLYDHSGTVYRVGQSNPFRCPWDSGRVGMIALKRSEWGNGHPTDAELTGYAQSVAEAYTDWANGECYGYVLFNADGVELDSCWGFVGLASVTAEANGAACDRRYRAGTGGSS